MPQQRLTTRRAHIEETRARRQFLMTFFVVGAGGLLFLFVAMPLIFRLVLAIATGDAGSVLSGNDDTLPPQVPQLTPPDDFINQKSFELSGFTEAKASVRLVVDAQEHGVEKAGDDGSFRFTIELAEGEHQVSLYAVDEAGNESATTAQYPVTIDTSAPSVTVDAPEEGAVFTLSRERTVEVRGKASEKGTVFVNSSRVSTDDEGVFSQRIQLGEGRNEIKVRVEDQAGNGSPEVIRVVEYRP